MEINREESDLTKYVKITNDTDLTASGTAQNNDAKIENSRLSIAIGHNALVKDSDTKYTHPKDKTPDNPAASIAVGANANVTESPYSIALGKNAKVLNSEYSLAAGTNAKVEKSEKAIVQGVEANATNSNISIVTDFAAKAENSKDVIVLGSKTESIRSNSTVALGNRTSVTDSDSAFVGGDHASATTSAGALVLGNGAKAKTVSLTADNGVLKAGDKTIFTEDNFKMLLKQLYTFEDGLKTKEKNGKTVVSLDKETIKQMPELKGEQGEQGGQGERGKSAHESWKALSANQGESETEFVEMLGGGASKVELQQLRTEHDSLKVQIRKDQKSI
ncbi:TPA: hypothetical protein ACPPOZ_001691 [Haemophilus influenzae]